MTTATQLRRGGAGDGRRDVVEAPGDQAADLKNIPGQSKSAWRLHTHFSIDRHVPTWIDVTGGKNSGQSDEKNVLREALSADCCYVMDRWLAEFRLFNDIHARSSSYVCRLRDNSAYGILEERPLSAAAQAVGVLSDQIVRLGATSSTAARPNHPIRLVLVACTPHGKTGGRKGGTAGPPSDGILRIATNLLDPPAEIIAELYRPRWTIEIFFRFFKHVLGCRH